MPADAIETVRHLMGDNSAERAVVHCKIQLWIKERRLQDRRRDFDLVGGRLVRGVDIGGQRGAWKRKLVVDDWACQLWQGFGRNRIGSGAWHCPGNRPGGFRPGEINPLLRISDADHHSSSLSRAKERVGSSSHGFERRRTSNCALIRSTISVTCARVCGLKNSLTYSCATGCPRHF